jgi:hypothetical protein
MNNVICLTILCHLLVSCASVQKPELKIGQHPRIIQYEPAVKENEKSWYQLEDENFYYAFYLLPKEQKEAVHTLEKITTNPKQQIEINYYKSGSQACLKSIKIEGNTFDMPEVTIRCDLYVSWQKSGYLYNHIRQAKPNINATQIKQFLRKNSSLKRYEQLIHIQAIKAGMPVKLLYFMWGYPESRFTDENKITLLTYRGWYVSIKNNKIFSFSSRDSEPIFIEDKL